MPAPKYAIGQVVIFVNPYGVNWGEKTITAHEVHPTRGHIYSYAGMVPEHFMTSECNLFELGDPEIEETARFRAAHERADGMGQLFADGLFA